eukprot:m.109965 g.109965  ORF g.109965 m.109965 type:complete len:321 (-) comp28001_c0_seq2:33-995(-)
MALQAKNRTIESDAQGMGSREFTPFRFVQMADTQLGMGATFGENFTTDSQKSYESEKEHMTLAISEINRLKPGFAIVCGDLVNAYPDTGDRKEEDAIKRKDEIKEFKSISDKIDPSIALICVCGNHDVGNRPTPESITEYTGEFGDDYFSFWSRGCKCIVVNSQFWKDDTNAKAISKEHDAWFKAELASAKTAKHVFVFGHIPLFIDTADEPDGYFNIVQPLRADLLDLLAQHGCTHYFGGHYHRNAGGIYKTKDATTVEVIVTGAVGTNIINKPGDSLGLTGIGNGTVNKNTSGLRIVDVDDDAVKHTWFSLNDLPNTN